MVVVVLQTIPRPEKVKRVIEILDTKYDKANLPEIVKDTCPHLEPSQQDMLPSLLLDYKSLFDGPLPNWNS